MDHFYILKYNPVFKYRNWFRIWNCDRQHNIKIILNPINNELICHFCDKHIITVSLLNNNSKCYYLSLTKTKKGSILYLPNQVKLQLNGHFNVDTIDITHWIDVIAYSGKTRIPITSKIVDSLSGEVDDVISGEVDDVISGEVDDVISGEVDDEPNYVNKIITTSYTNYKGNTENRINNIDKIGKIEEISDIIINKEGNTIYKNKDRVISDGSIDTESSEDSVASINSNLIKPQLKLYPILEYLSHLPPKKLSFCITCMKRLSQIKQTLGINLKHNIPLQYQIEFVVIDFGTEGLYEWIYENFTWALNTGYLRYLRTDKLTYWHASVAKNTSHYYANGDILVNLDCDNYTGKLGSLHIINIFKKYGNQILFHQWSGTSKDGTYGRISYHRDTFFQLGGYDQRFLPMGYQDHDLIMRFQLLKGSKNAINYDKLNQIKSKYQIFRQLYSRAIENDKGKSMANTNYVGKMKWQTMNAINKENSHKNLINGIYQVNRNLNQIGIKIY